MQDDFTTFPSGCVVKKVVKRQALPLFLTLPEMQEAHTSKLSRHALPLTLTRPYQFLQKGGIHA